MQGLAKPVEAHLSETHRPPRPTLADIARALSVSESTVSRALRGNPDIGPATTARVRETARALGYVPNLAARSLAGKPAQMLGLIVPDVTDPVHAQVVAGFGRAAQDRNYAHIVLESGRNPARSEAALRTLVKHRAQGIAFASDPLDPQGTAAALAPAHVVFLMPEAEEPTRGDAAVGILRSDEVSGMRALTRHLLRHGRSRLSWVSGAAIPSNRLRRAALLAAMEEAGVEPRLRDFRQPRGDGDLRDLAEAVRRERPDALVCFDDVTALHVMDALHQAGLAVPEDIAVTGFDGIAFSRFSRPRLTTVVQPAERIGALGAAMLVDAIEDGQALREVLLPTRLAIRASS